MQTLVQKFEAIFKVKSEQYFFAPGRINLIGEHTDYNGGHVFPASITLGTYAITRKREDRKIRFYSDNFETLGIIEVSLDDLSYKVEDNWVNYPKGVISQFIKQNYSIEKGFDILYYGNIPNGAGLSSSASIEVLTGIVLKSLYQFDIDMIDIVKIGKQVENHYIGVNSGIMDQFAIGMGQLNKAIFLDTNTLAYELVPADIKDNVIVIMNTNKRRELSDSKYNERRSECEEALSRLQKVMSINSLGELSSIQFEQYKHLINDNILERRAKHAIYENERTILAKQALVHQELVQFGKLLNASHQSLQYDYEVTGVELDTLALTAQQFDGCLGARMTGAGFGGCAIALVNRNKVKEFIRFVGDAYENKIGYAASFYVANIGEGAREISYEALLGEK